MKWIQQGDVKLTPVAELPKDAKQVEWDGVIAEGEHTGHMHRMIGDSQKFETPNGDVFMNAPKRILLAHEKGGAVADHNPVVIEHGVYKVESILQYDYATKEAVEVVD
jgi:hypothetical protein